MKKKVTYYAGGELHERQLKYVPIRYIFSMSLVVFNTLLIFAAVGALLILVPYFYIAILILQAALVIYIVAADNNPDFKIPWLLLVLVMPGAGMLLYVLFARRKLSKKLLKRLNTLQSIDYHKNSDAQFTELKKECPAAFSQAQSVCSIAKTHLFTHTKQQYFSLGEDMHRAMLDDLKKAQRFIFLEYFIIEEGACWHSILAILKDKVAAGVEVRVIFDDIGCMMKLPGNYVKTLNKMGIKATVFARLKGKTDSEFNNRSHRKITVIDGKVGYTGGINLADEYINREVKFGHWKDGGIRLEGQAVSELTKLFLTDFFINVKNPDSTGINYFPECEKFEEKGYVVPFGDGPRPVYERRVGKTVIQNLVNAATDYVYLTTPYLILDNELCTTLENAAYRGVKVKIITPHIPDKKIVFALTRSYYPRLMKAGVEIYEYAPGFIHAKSYLADGKFGMVGTINLDYRSLVHHFENGVWMYDCDCLNYLKADIDQTLQSCVKMEPRLLNRSILNRMFCAVLRIFAPML